MHTRNLKMILLLQVAMITLSASVFAGHYNNKRKPCPPTAGDKQAIAKLQKTPGLNFDAITLDSCQRPIITSATVVYPGGRIRVCYILPTPCDSCTIFVYNPFNILVTSVPNICGTSCATFKFLDTCSYYRFLVKCHNDTCGTVVSDTFYYNGCSFRQGIKKETTKPILRTIRGNLGYSGNMLNIHGIAIPSQGFNARMTYYRKKDKTFSYDCAKTREWEMDLLQELATPDLAKTS